MAPLLCIKNRGKCYIASRLAQKERKRVKLYSMYLKGHRQLFTMKYQRCNNCCDLVIKYIVLGIT